MLRAPLLVTALLSAPIAQALPLSAALSVPRLSLELLIGQSAPPVVVPDAPVTPPPHPGAAPIPWTDGQDRLKLRDGRELHGRILSQVQDGFLFNDAASNTTFVVPFAQIVDLQRAQSTSLPMLAPSQRDPTQRLLLESQLLDLQTRQAAISIWPGIEELIGGGVGLGGCALLLLFLGTSDGVEVAFAVLAGVTGAISLVSGVISLVSAEHQRDAYGSEIAKIQEQLSRLPPIAAQPMRPSMVAFRF